MPFCPSCGKEVSREAIYCPYCGSQVRRGADEDWKAGTGLDLLMVDKGVQFNWVNRLVAYLIDSIIVGIATFIVSWLLTIPFIINALLTWSWSTWRGAFGLPFSMGVVQVIYFTLIEGGYASSIGKQIMGLKVVDIEGNPPTFFKALVRNISKVYWALLLLDVFIGLLSRADPRQKYTDQMAGTKVASLRVSRFGISVPRPSPLVEKGSTTHPKKEEDPLGLVSVGITLIIMATVFILYPGIFPEFIAWLEGGGEAGPIMIPAPLINPLIWFFLAQGVWSLVLAVVRVISGINRRSSISDAFGGVFLLTAAFLFREYVSGLMPLTVLLPSLAIALGSVVLLASAVSYMLHGRL